ncbi:hypothetical protein L2735_08765 [Shewanella olleyana]|uniref:hypothetical protein n=1 Tax=Shewanella olleyana TaxID=135626 RepID=UPI002010B8EB|nr:hypothetical protein [Shewanella olleyana]MCL1066896.1 hypothetical protein [Shewanella olleyana]
MSKVSVNPEDNTGVDSTVGALGAILPFFTATKAEDLAAKLAQVALQRADSTPKDLSAAEKKENPIA